MIVDMHHHYTLESYYTEYTDYPRELVAAMDRYGWDRVCLNGIGPRRHSHGNEDVLKAVKRFPDRLVGIGWLNVDGDRPGKVAEFKSQGMKGLKIIATHKRYDDDSYLPFYEAAAGQGLPILFHAGFLAFDSTLSDDESSDYYRPMVLDRVARLYPKLVIICAHLGFPWYDEMLALMNHPNVYADASGGAWGRPPELYQSPLYHPLAWEKVMFGSDSLANDGHIPYNGLKKLLAGLKLDEATQKKVFGETAAKVFGLE